MKKFSIPKTNNLIKMVVLASMLLLTISPVRSFAQVSFVRGNNQSLTICANATDVSLDSALSVNDATAGRTESWFVQMSPSHGSFSRTSYITSSTGGTLYPSGWNYTPTAGYSGSDSFAITVGNGTDSATTIIRVTINPSPTVGTISGVTHQCVGNVVSFTNSVSGGVWFSTNTSVATISTSGTLTALSTGTTSLIYTITNGFGCADVAFALDTVLAPPVVSSSTGSPSVCVGFTTTLSNTTGGGRMEQFKHCRCNRKYLWCCIWCISWFS